MNYDPKRTGRTSYKKKRKKRLVAFILTPFLLLLLSGAGYAGYLYYKAQNVMGDSFSPVDAESKREEAIDPKFDNFSLLLIGVDDSEKRGFGEKGTRSDALMVVTLNKEEHSVKMVSIPRDSYVNIPGYENKTRINHAHSRGGTALTIETVQNLLDIPIDYYVKMNFNAFMDVVDALGGIEVEVPFTITEQDSRDRKDAITLQPGLQTLDGEEALAFARTRHVDSDIQRGLRQQEVLKAIFSKAVSVGSISKHADVIEAVGNNMKTDLTFKDMKSFIAYAAEGNNLNFENISLEGSDYTLNRAYYYQLDEASLEQVKQKLKIHLGLLNDTTAASSDNSVPPSESTMELQEDSDRDSTE